ncbi:hypothetical protein [Pseudomonas sp. Ant30-3]|nr:hypothetical protein [Pseudomonas sp. Ant30-3]
MTGYQSWVVSGCDRVYENRKKKKEKRKKKKEKRVAEATLFYQSRNK